MYSNVFKCIETYSVYISILGPGMSWLLDLLSLLGHLNTLNVSLES